MTLFPSELGCALNEGGLLSGEVRELDELADKFLERAAATDPERFARVAARNPTIPLRSLARPRRVRGGGKQREVRDISIDTDEARTVDRLEHVRWAEDNAEFDAALDRWS